MSTTSKGKPLSDEPAIIAEHLPDQYNRKLGRSYLKRDELEAARGRLIASLRANAINEKATTKALASKKMDAVKVFQKFDDSAKSNAKQLKEFQKMVGKKDMSLEQNEQVLQELQREMKHMSRHKSRLQTRLTAMDHHAKEKKSATRKTGKDTSKLSKTIAEQVARVEMDKASIDALIGTWESVGTAGSAETFQVSARADDAISNWVTFWPTMQMMLAGESAAVASFKTCSSLQGLLAEWWALHALAVDVDALTQICSDEMLLTMKMDYTDAIEMFLEVLGKREAEARNQAAHQAQLMTELEKRRTMLKEMALSLVYALEQDCAKSSSEADEVLGRTLSFYMEQKERRHDAQKRGRPEMDEAVPEPLTVEMAQKVMNQLVSMPAAAPGMAPHKQEDTLIGSELAWVRAILTTTDMGQLNSIVEGRATLPLGAVMRMPPLGLDTGSLVSMGSKVGSEIGGGSVSAPASMVSDPDVTDSYGPAERAARDSSLALMALEVRRLFAGLEVAVMGHVLTSVQKGAPRDGAESLESAAQGLLNWQDEHNMAAHAAVSLDTAFPSAPGWIAGRTAMAMTKLTYTEEHVGQAIERRRKSVQRLSSQATELANKKVETPQKLRTRAEQQEVDELESDRKLRGQQGGLYRYPFISALAHHEDDDAPPGAGGTELRATAAFHSTIPTPVPETAWNEDGKENEGGGGAGGAPLTPHRPSQGTPRGGKGSFAKAGMSHKVSAHDDLPATPNTPSAPPTPVTASPRGKLGGGGRKKSVLLPNLNVRGGVQEMIIGGFQALGSLAGTAGNVQSAAAQRGLSTAQSPEQARNAAATANNERVSLVGGAGKWTKVSEKLSEINEMAVRGGGVETVETVVTGDNYNFEGDTSGINGLFAEMLSAAPKRVIAHSGPAKTDMGKKGKGIRKASAWTTGGFVNVVATAVEVLDEETMLTRFVGKLAGKAGLLVDAKMTWQPTLQRIHFIVTTMMAPDEFHFFFTPGDLRECFAGHPELQAASHQNSFLANALLRRVHIESMPLSETFALIAKPKYSGELARAGRALGTIDSGEAEEHIMVATVRKEVSDYERRVGTQGALQAVSIGVKQLELLERGFSGARIETLGISNFDEVLAISSGAIQ